jgi:hypothetical protein
MEVVITARWQHRTDQPGNDTNITRVLSGHWSPKGSAVYPGFARGANRTTTPTGVWFGTFDRRSDDSSERPEWA